MSLRQESIFGIKIPFEKILKYFLIFTFVVFVLGILWAAFRRIQICDEAFSLLLYENPQNELFPSTYYIIVNKLFGWMGVGISGYRIINLLFNISGSFIFYAGFLNWINNLYKIQLRFWSKLSIFLFIAIGNLISIFVFSGGLDYNDLNKFLILASSGCLLWTIGKSKISEDSSFAIYICGILTGIDFFVKFPASIIFLLCASIIIPEKRKNLLKLYCGFAIGMIIYFLLFQSALSWWPLFLESLQFQITSGSSHNPDIVWNIYVNSLSVNISTIIKYFFFPITLTSLGFFSLRFKEKKVIKWIQAILFGTGVVLFCKSIIKIHLYYPKDLKLFITVFLIIIMLQTILLLISYLEAETNLKINFQKVMPIAIILFLLPFIMSFGTNIPLVLQAYNNIMPWFALSIFMSILGMHFSKINYKVQLVLPFSAVFFSWVYFICIFILCVNHPNFGIFNQNHKVSNIPKLKHMQVDYESKKLIEDTHKLLLKADFKKGDNLIGENIPLFVYIFDAKSPGSYWYNSQFTKAACRVVDSANKELDKSYFLLPSVIDVDLFECLMKYDIFKDHVYVGRVKLPYRLYDIPSKADLMLYKPIHK